MNINGMTKSNGRYLPFLTFVSRDPGFFPVAFYGRNHEGINNKGCISHSKPILNKEKLRSSGYYLIG